MDPEIKRELQLHTEEKIDLVKKEMAWEEEKHRVALEKLKNRSADFSLSSYLLISMWNYYNKILHSEYEIF